ncbi:unnamed protein product, partial [Allacma fusca]
MNGKHFQFYTALNSTWQISQVNILLKLHNWKRIFQ